MNLVLFENMKIVAKDKSSILYYLNEILESMCPEEYKIINDTVCIGNDNYYENYRIFDEADDSGTLNAYFKFHYIDACIKPELYYETQEFGLVRQDEYQNIYNIAKQCNINISNYNLSNCTILGGYLMSELRACRILTSNIYIDLIPEEVQNLNENFKDTFDDWEYEIRNNCLKHFAIMHELDKKWNIA